MTLLKIVTIRLVEPLNSIVTQTSNRWDIPNFQLNDLYGNEEMLTKRFQEKHGARVRARATSRYNCHGLTFAARRTCIEDLNAVANILEHDNYKFVPNDNVMPGDIVLYYDPVDGAISHSGIVVGVSTDSPALIVSKWGPSGAEFLHWVNRSEYGMIFKFFRVDNSTEVEALSKIILGT